MDQCYEFLCEHLGKVQQLFGMSYERRMTKLFAIMTRHYISASALPSCLSITCCPFISFDLLCNLSVFVYYWTIRIRTFNILP